jgi:hypothetical protein
MQYHSAGKTAVRVPLIPMGGHEYLSDGRSWGFNEDFARATRPGYIFVEFGLDRRREVLWVTYERGDNLFDVTQDSEQGALGRNFKDMPPPYHVYVQAHPEGMVYTYDLYNQRMADYAELKAEVERGLGILRRERVEFFNSGIMRSVLNHAPEFLGKLGRNIAALKREGLIRFGCGDTFYVEETFPRQIGSGSFDAINLSLNFADYGGLRAFSPPRTRKDGAFSAARRS